ncbi:low molecular weight protein-tyrosine-phosphatase [Plebeiibacterium sediminum]|uniref:Low molecular weight phosphotyrosine protein phosphatase n=1 Tax=Plebeiibacterium sediminum TaxID=2992112 RepID=A0AAE3SER4_9BACT|nr:low molecular weight protein-tyrosine-phosphatase [Plebeiobacterium sediminum]MCW3786660.1 low molecular weight phosphotyrosine protein phosphatase [Plebeiobacterium sediminum]
MNKKSILFVCLGNICRSPSAEAVMKALVKEKGLQSQYYIDSAGITGFHAGEPADSRMKQHALRRNYHLTSSSRPVDPKIDFEEFDYIIGMDDQNIRDLNNLAKTDQDRSKISKMTDYCTRFVHDSVPDPYYGGASGFELVLDLLEDACEGLINKLENE